MRKHRIPFLLVLIALLAGCAPSAAPASDPGGALPEESSLTVLCTTYPTYLLANGVAQGVQGITVTRLDTGETSCLHDYTLTVIDMKQVEGADVIVMNGAGLEDFMADALAASGARTIDCSAGIDLLTVREDDFHSHSESDMDPHIWMDPIRAQSMAQTIADGLAQADPGQAELYGENAAGVTEQLGDWHRELSAMVEQLPPEKRNLITFHDGFQYFADSFGFTVLTSIEEEEGSEASAKEINEIIALIEEYSLPAIFTELNGADATANAIARETGCSVGVLSMMMSGEDATLDAYNNTMYANITTLVQALL